MKYWDFLFCLKERWTLISAHKNYKQFH
jgi:hypothetical protein